MSRVLISVAEECSSWAVSSLGHRDWPLNQQTLLNPLYRRNKQRLVSMTVRACYASTQETEAGGPGVSGQCGLHGGGLVVNLWF